MKARSENLGIIWLGIYIAKTFLFILKTIYPVPSMVTELSWETWNENASTNSVQINFFFVL